MHNNLTFAVRYNFRFDSKGSFIWILINHLFKNAPTRLGTLSDNTLRKEKNAESIFDNFIDNNNTVIIILYGSND